MNNRYAGSGNDEVGGSVACMGDPPAHASWSWPPAWAQPHWPAIARGETSMVPQSLSPLSLLFTFPERCDVPNIREACTRAHIRTHIPLLNDLRLSTLQATTMNALLQSRLTTLESALTALTDSLAANNPSPAAAHDLVTADEALSAGLQQLAAHQRRTAQLRALRAESAALDARFTQALSSLAEARQTLLAVPLTPPPPPPPLPTDPKAIGAARPVAATDVLAAARTALRIVPRRADRPPPPAQHAVEPASAATDGSAGPAATAGAGQEEEGRNPGLRVLDERERAWLGPDGHGGGSGGGGEEELPWPSEAMIARSGLARSQGWARAVYDEGGGGVGGAPGDGEDEGRREEEEREKERQAATAHQQQMQQPRPRPSGEEGDRPKVFTGMELYDPEED